jgi:squalene-hopene/tetraprenyl-beta-curcumene cyclase
MALVLTVAEARGAAPSDDLAKARREAIAKGVAFLKGSQKQDGSWSMGRGDVGVTALCADALLSAGRTVKDPAVVRALTFIAKAQHSDGSICDTPPQIKVYSTSIAVTALQKAGANSQIIKRATAFLLKAQGGATGRLTEKDPAYGGLGYNGAQRGADLSNTHFFVQALHDAKVPANHPAWKRLQVFLSRCQNRSESNDNLFPSTDDGGAIYTPMGGGRSSAGTVELPDGRQAPRSYGSMTYALYMGFGLAHVAPDDPRVQAAWHWIRKNWTFEENPGSGQAGLYYYHMVAAKALSARGQNPVEDARGRQHDWKAELTGAIVRRQREDGSWLNPRDRWFEGYPPVPTSYCLIALAACNEPR